MRNFLTQTDSFKEWSRDRKKCNRVRSEISSIQAKVDNLDFSKITLAADVTNYFPSLQTLTNIGVEVDKANEVKSQLEAQIETMNNEYFAAYTAENNRKKMIKRVIIVAVLVVAYVIFKFVL